jgi:outer membrane receptor protein involved in Fe transport
MNVQDKGQGMRPQSNLLSQAIADVIGRSTRSRGSFAAASGGALLSAAMLVAPTMPAHAQDQATSDAAAETVVVTGSRIPRRDFTANSPIMTVDESLFNETSLIGAETILNQMPQFVPAVTQFTTADVQQTATNTVGASTVSLRGLGPNRNLVLINGRRAMPVDPTMVVDTNSIPSSAIARVEVISGGASAVYGADAVGGVVNFVLKDDFEGASIDMRVADTEHGGNQEITFSGLIGANMAGDRGNVMIGVERATRTKQWTWERDWRVEDYANPTTGGGFFTFGSSTSWKNTQGTTGNDPTQAAVDAIFSDLPPGSIPNNMTGPGSTEFYMSDSGQVFTGLQSNNTSAAGAYRFDTAPIYNGDEFCPAGVTCQASAGTGDLDGNFLGLPVFVRQPNGNIKENQLYAWASSPLERLSAFANGHFDVSDNIRVTSQASISRTQTESSLGLTAANINQWGVGIPFGDGLYRGDTGPYSKFDIPDSLCELNAAGALPTGCTAVGVTNNAYTIGGRFDVECDAAPTADMPWLDGLPGCTKSEAFPTSAEVYNLFSSRQDDPEAEIWASRPPDWLRNAIGAGRSTTNTTTTMNFSIGVEGDLPSGNDFWDINLSTGRTDNAVQQRGSIRLSSYRDLLRYPNFGKGALFDPNPYEDNNFAEGIPTCTTGLPIVERFTPSSDCVAQIAPVLKNEREMTQTILEANLVGDLAEMPAGALQYALGLAYRENSFKYEPDNLSDNANQIDPIAGLFPNEASFGKYDVTEIYGELLVPIVSNGPSGVEHFNVELGARVSDWSMPQMPNLETYKALIDWAITPRYRLRGGFNRAFRAPNLGELFITRTQIFGGGGSDYGDHCSTNLDTPSTWSATPADHVPTVRDAAGNIVTPAVAGTPTAQTAQTLAICQALMGTGGTAQYYGRPLDELPTVGGLGIANSFGNPNLREEKADTWTLGTVMDFHDNFTLTVDWYTIEIEDLVALAGADSTYQKCLDIEFNPTGNPNTPECQLIFRDPSSGGGAQIERTFNNEGFVTMSGVDLQFNWQRPIANGGFSLTTVANYNLEATTQDSVNVAPIDHAGFNDCGLQIQCQRYDYRLFSTFSYARGSWNVSLRHQYWPELANSGCRTNLQSNGCLYSSLPSYNLFAMNAGYTFADRYRVNVGIENLLDEEPPCTGQNPNGFPFATTCTHGSGGSTYDPLGRRFYMSMTMDF